jgi:ribose transport system substrate-binding protein
VKWPAVTIAVALVLLTSCDRHRKKVIAVIPKATSHLFWLSVQAGAFAAGDEFGVEVVWNGPALETDFSRQIQIVDSMTARHVDGIAIAAAERKALVQSVDRAMAAGIPVTVFDSGLDSTNYLSFVATDNFEAGKLAARALGKLLGGKGKAAVVAHVPGSFSTMERERGFDEAMAKEFPGIQIVDRRFGMSDRAKSLAAAENILTAHPGLDGIFASTEPSSVGTAMAVKARNLSGKIKFVAFDSSDGMIDDLKGGTIDAIVAQDPFGMGRQAVKTIVDKLQGQTPPKQMDLPAIVVFKPDLDKPEIRSVLFPDVKKYIHQ